MTPPTDRPAALAPTLGPPPPPGGRPPTTGFGGGVTPGDGGDEHGGYGDGVDVHQSLPGQDAPWNTRRFLITQVVMGVAAVAAAVFARAVYPSIWVFFASFGLLALAWQLVFTQRARAKSKVAGHADEVAANEPPSEEPNPQASDETRVILLSAASSAYMLVAMVILATCAEWATGSTLVSSLLSVAMGPWPLLLFVAAFAWPSTSSVPTKYRCRRCHHERTLYPLLGNTPPIGCRRCHLPWRVPARRRVRIAGVPRVVITIWSASTVAFVLIFIPMLTAKVLPTSMLIDTLGGTSQASWHAWNELDSRTLTPEQHNRLFMLLADRRARGLPIPWLADQWVRENLHALRMDPRHFAAYFPDWYDIGLVRVDTGQALTGPGRGPDLTVEQGSSLSVALGVTRYDQDMAGLLPLVYIEGFWMGDRPDSIQHAQTTSMYSMGGRSGERWRELALNLDAPPASFTFNTQGRTTIRAAVWLVVPASRSATPDITWNPDGTLSAPNALHVERRELVIPVDVR